MNYFRHCCDRFPSLLFFVRFFVIWFVFVCLSVQLKPQSNTKLYENCAFAIWVVVSKQNLRTDELMTMNIKDVICVWFTYNDLCESTTGRTVFLNDVSHINDVCVCAVVIITMNERRNCMKCGKCYLESPALWFVGFIVYLIQSICHRPIRTILFVRFDVIIRCDNLVATYLKKKQIINLSFESTIRNFRKKKKWFKCQFNVNENQINRKRVIF